ncbi:HNH endonuclease [Bacillales bacterium AN1005]
MTEHEAQQTKTCMYCGQKRPLSEFRRRTGKRAGRARRGACRSCRKSDVQAADSNISMPHVRHSERANSEKRVISSVTVPADSAVRSVSVQASKDSSASSVIESISDKQSLSLSEPSSGHRKKRRRKRKAKRPDALLEKEQTKSEPDQLSDQQLTVANPEPKSSNEDSARVMIPTHRTSSHGTRNRGLSTDRRQRRQNSAEPVAIDPEDPSSLRTNRQGLIRMRGKTDKGRRWHQEIDMELAVTLVREKAAVVVNRYTIRRLFSNKDFKRFILNRDQYTCYFCGSYGDTIDHLLPRAKGGHTTPLNCVCACNLCNQSKAAMDANEFIRSGIPEWNAAHQEELIQIQLQEAQLD